MAVRRVLAPAAIGVSSLILGSVGAVVLLVGAVLAYVGIRDLTSDGPSGRARHEAAALFVTASGVKVASVRTCNQVSVDDPYRTFRCEVATPRCSRSFLFIEEADDFGGHDLQLSDRPDRTLTRPCIVKSD